MDRMISFDVVAASAAENRLFEQVLVRGVAESIGADKPLTHVLGLDPVDLALMLGRRVPELLEYAMIAPHGDDRGDDAIEEDDLRSYLMDHAVDAAAECRWWAAMVARRALQPNHLWQDMGFSSRDQLNLMFSIWFPALVDANFQNMKWKKFFYRQLCEREGVLVCKSPSCESCEDLAVCFGPEE